jgi:RimJ/RimL family protein N-acetyltransferase
VKGSPDSMETDRLLIRRFTPADWQSIQALARDKASSEAVHWDHAWPTDDDGCKGMADYLANSEAFWAVVLKRGADLVGLIHIGDVEDEYLELGHLFHTKVSDEDYAREALGHVMDYAFTHLDIKGIEARNAEEWTVQVAPLIELGMQVTDCSPASFAKDENGEPIEFNACRMEITRQTWRQRHT